MYPRFLYECCKHYLGIDAKAYPAKLYCKAFPNGDGISPNHPCCLMSNFGFFDGKDTPPKVCANGFCFELKDGYRDPRVIMEEARQRGEDWPEE